MKQEINLETSYRKVNSEWVSIKLPRRLCRQLFIFGRIILKGEIEVKEREIGKRIKAKELK